MNRYGVILCDFPWEHRNGGNGAAKNHYLTMTVEQGIAMPIESLAGRDSVLLFWATWPHLPDALPIIGAWGFEYVTGFPWVKLQDHPVVDLWGHLLARPAYGIGMWVRGCSEMILIAKRGNAKPPAMNWLGLLSKRMQHSRKPDDIYEYAESFPGPYLELFARQRREGWDAFGNQVEGSIQIESAIRVCE